MQSFWAKKDRVEAPVLAKICIVLHQEEHTLTLEKGPKL